jgi:nitric oxide reductase subunit B
MFLHLSLLALSQTHHSIHSAAGTGRSRRTRLTPACRRNTTFSVTYVNGIIANFPGRLAAVYEHGFAYARSNALYFWQWVRFTGDVAFALGALLMAADFIIKLGPLYPSLARRLRSSQHTPASS